MKVFPKDHFVIKEKSKDNPMFMMIYQGECEILKDIHFSSNSTRVIDTHRESFSLVSEGSLIGGEPCFFNRPHSYSVKVKSPELTVLTMSYEVFNARMKDITPEISSYIKDRCKWMEIRVNLIIKSKETLNSMKKNQLDGFKTIAIEEPPGEFKHASLFNKKKMLLSVKRRLELLGLNCSNDDEKTQEEIKLRETQKLKEKIEQVLTNQTKLIESNPLTLRSHARKNSNFVSRKNTSPLVLMNFNALSTPNSDSNTPRRTKGHSLAVSPRTGSPVSFVRNQSILNSVQFRIPNKMTSNISFNTTFGSPFDKCSLKTADSSNQGSELYILHSKSSNYQLEPLISSPIIKRKKFNSSNNIN